MKLSFRTLQRRNALRDAPASQIRAA
ncbi:DUF1534 domain-containing protein [Pseudomonas syringae pv. tomato]|nr:hypothetical protein DND90_06135 [Pseudomonas syringae pv. maculicola]QBI65671.1 DUF1534 domain-containing protein [Pseudomonas syringae]TES67440.1 DUF1534 domain-containing protein [Pseudomonas syringae pv. tomato]